MACRRPAAAGGQQIGGKLPAMPRGTSREGPPLANPFRNILKLSVGDFIAKALTFAAFVWLARVLGVQTFGVLEFAGSLLAWFLLLADGGLELWATREAARTEDVPWLVARVMPLRFLLAAASFVLLFLLLPVLPATGNLRLVLALFGLSLFAQAASLKWLFLGREQMGRIGAVLVAGQLLFALAVIALIRHPEQVLWVPLIKFAADCATAAGFARLYRAQFGSFFLHYTFSGARVALSPAVTIGLTQAMGLLNFNFDTLLIGFLLGLSEVGLYNAAYKPVITLLAVPLTYFTGLFPALARAWNDGPEALRPIAERSLHLCALFSLPAGVAGSLLAQPLVIFLFGPNYAVAALPFSILVWSAVLVILRGTFRHSLNAAGHQKLDLRCAIISSAVNVGLNLFLIPRSGLAGAAAATVTADVVWFYLAAAFCKRHVLALHWMAAFWRPVVASAALAVFLLYAPIAAWPVRALAGAATYAGACALLGERLHALRGK